MSVEILHGDCRETLKTLPDASVHCCVTSPPYFGLRDYGHDGQIGLEESPDAFVQQMVAVFREVKRVLRDDGTLWLNLGDSYAGSGKGRNPDGTVHVSALLAKQGTSAGTVMGNVPSGLVPEGMKAKDLIGIPWRVAFALQADGWYLRQDIIWHKPNPMPESVTDRCTKAHEYIFLLSKSARYFYDAEAIEEDAKWERWGNQTENKKHAGTAGHLGGKTLEQLPIRDKKNKRSVWSVSTKSYSGAHFATFPPDLIRPCILAGCPTGGTVLDPFGGSGTTGQVAMEEGRNAILCELNADYVGLIRKRIGGVTPSLFGRAA
jgi:site-specific DNA-methyltransferase (adenine-specific)